MRLAVGLSLPPDLATGVYDLVLRPQGGEPAAALGPVTVAGRPHFFEPPPLGLPMDARFGDAVALLGAELDGDLAARAGQPLVFTLAWQALGTPQANLVHFVHLLGPDNQLVAQQDAVPCQGACPASSWLPGEILLDPVELALPVDLPVGGYTLAVGWYDAAAPAQQLSPTNVDRRLREGRSTDLTSDRYSRAVDDYSLA